MAAAALHWPPPAFWSATPHELYDALAALRTMNGGEDEAAGAAEFADFRRRMEAAGQA